MRSIEWVLSNGLLLLVALDFGVGRAAAASVAAKNREGNRLFEGGKYQDAEKAYLDAQLEAPGRPELLYNLGNAMIRQKKYDQAAQSLRQAVSKGKGGIQANSWYNLGNSLFESGKYQEAVQAYIQALRMNPADRDAKHNLELTWRRLKEQEQASSEQKQNQQNRPDSNQNQQQSQNAPGNKDKDQSGGAQGEQDRKQDAQSQPSQVERREGTISKERALQILDAMKNQELAEQRKLLERQARRKTSGKDW